MTKRLSAGRAFDAIVANNDEMATGAVRAMKAAAKDMADVVIGGVDATQDALAAGDLDVTVFQNAAGRGKGAVDAALKLARRGGGHQDPCPVRADDPGTTLRGLIGGHAGHGREVSRRVHP